MEKEKDLSEYLPAECIEEFKRRGLTVEEGSALLLTKWREVLGVMDREPSTVMVGVKDEDGNIGDWKPVVMSQDGTLEDVCDKYAESVGDAPGSFEVASVMLGNDE